MISAVAFRTRPQTVLLLVAVLAPYDGLLLLVDLPGWVDGWKEALVILGLALAWMQRTQAAARPEGARSPGWAVPLGLLMGLAAVTVLRAPSAQALFGFKVSFFYVLVPITLVWAPFSRRDRDRLVSILMVNGFVTACVGISQQFIGHQRLNQLGYAYNEVIRFADGTLRSFSTFNQPFPFAFFLMVVVLVATPIALDDRDRLRNRLFLLALPLLVAGMATAVVRGALLGLLAGGVVLLIRHRVLAHVLVVLPAVIVAGLLIVDAEAFTSGSSLESRATGWVSEVVDEGVDPLGRGIGATGSAAERFDEGATDSFPAPPPVDRYQPDNHYIKFLIELGPIGLWLFLVTIAFIVRDLWRTEQAAPDRPDRALCQGVQAATVAAVAAALVATYWEIFPADFIFWILIGAVSSIDNTSSSTPSRSDRAVVASRPMVGSSSDTWRPTSMAP